MNNSLELSAYSQDPPQISPEIKGQITNKYRVFSRWNVRKELIKNSRETKKLVRENTEDDMMKALLAYAQQISKQESKKKNKKQPLLEDAEALEEQKRQRLKKVRNPFQILQHYERKGYNLTLEQETLSKKIIELKAWIDKSPTFNLERTLKQIYKIMNMAVDLNELKFLILVIMLAANICREWKDFKRAFYFYHQAKIAATYANCLDIKEESMIGMGRVALEMNCTREAIILFKKALAYAWRINDIENEVIIYDYLGQTYFAEGKMKKAAYYHTRYIQNELEPLSSAIRKIGWEILHDYQKNYIVKDQDANNLHGLFIEYLKLPITNFESCPQTTVSSAQTYNNYIEGNSPRKKKQSRAFGYQQFQQVQQQLQKLLKRDPEFFSDIPNPDIHHNFVASARYGRQRHTIQFQRSHDYHKITGYKSPQIRFDQMNKNSVEKRMQKMMKEKADPEWYEKMVKNVKKQRLLKTGKLKDLTRKTHLSLNKYPLERKRAVSVQNDRVKVSFNTTLIDWIDPKNK